MFCLSSSLVRRSYMQSSRIQLSIVILVVMPCWLLSIATYKVHLSSAWYPTKKHELYASLAKHGSYAEQHYDVQTDQSKIKALICPHAGFDYSGSIAAAGYRLLPKNYYKRVIILAPSHHTALTGLLLPN
ncbi:MAG: AmmeMemoRadiSam system protein B [Epsilonproteobacteria bacterium]|nr:AmmeMemoRadiSam system protein B [Campylobacterota bacterium]